MTPDEIRRRYAPRSATFDGPSLSSPGIGLSGMPATEAYDPPRRIMTPDEIKRRYDPRYRASQTADPGTSGNSSSYGQQHTSSNSRAQSSDFSQGYRSSSANSYAGFTSHPSDYKNGANMYGSGRDGYARGGYSASFEPAPASVWQDSPESARRRAESDARLMAAAGVAPPQAHRRGQEQRTPHESGSSYQSAPRASYGTYTAEEYDDSDVGSRYHSTPRANYDFPIVEEYNGPDVSSRYGSSPRANRGPAIMEEFDFPDVDSHYREPNQFGSPYQTYHLQVSELDGGSDLSNGSSSRRWSHPCGPHCSEVCSHHGNIHNREIYEVDSEEELVIENARASHSRAGSRGTLIHVLVGHIQLLT